MRRRDRAPVAPAIHVFLCGDVMTGRGVDQILPCPSDPTLFEGHLSDAREYVKLAEAVNGAIPKSVAFGYVWGDALEVWDRLRPDVRIVNLETSITTSNAFCPKGINYRMHPKNVGCLTRARIDCCALANNHVLDFGHDGLLETLDTLRQAGIQTSGAGRSLSEARCPAILDVPSKGRVLVFSLGSASSGISRTSDARIRQPGIFVFDEFSLEAVDAIASGVRSTKRSGDVSIASVHWGGNWSYSIPAEQVAFAHALVDEGGIDVVHGHSSHHPKGFEIYREKLILYGCGDFLNDYEGISGHEEFRSDLVLMYFVVLSPPTGALLSLTMVPLRICRLRLNRTAMADVEWLNQRLNEASLAFDARIVMTEEGSLLLLCDGGNAPKP